MPRQQLTLASIAKVRGGLVDLMLTKALSRMAADIDAAPDIPDWRKVTLTIRAKPVLEHGELDDVAVEFDIGAKTPNRVTSARMEVRADDNGARQLQFELDALDNPDQLSLLDQADDLPTLLDELERSGRAKLANQLAGLIDDAKRADDDRHDNRRED